MKNRQSLMKRSGSSTVEFAVTLPILILLVFGGVELGRISMLRHTADHAAYLAARSAIVPGADANTAKQIAIDHLELHGISGYSITLTPDPIGPSTSLVDVEVTFPVADNSFVVPEYVTGNIDGKCMLVTERPPAEMAISIPAPPPPPAPPTPPVVTDDDDDDDDDDDFVIPIVPSPGPSTSPTPSPTPAPSSSPPPPTHSL